MIAELQNARRYSACGLSVIPIRTDGSKAPAVEWKAYQTNRADEKVFHDWYSTANNYGIGIVCGGVSGSLEVIDFDDASTLKPWLQFIINSGAKDLANRLVINKTPKGYHALYRCPGAIEPNRKLARRKGEGGDAIVLIETRGEGGYVIAPGSPTSCHPSNLPYTVARGTLESIPVLTADERDLLIEAAVSFNELFDPIYTPKASATDGGVRPGDEFNSRANWDTDVLAKAGWKKIKQTGEASQWIRPGSNSKAPHATLNHANSDRMYVFSSRCHPLEAGRSYDKYQAYALLFHDGNFAEASKALSKAGYGQKSSAKLAKDAPKENPPNSGADEEFTAWEAPILFGKINTPDIPSDVLPHKLAAFAEALSKALQISTGLTVLLILSAVSTCVQRRFVVSILEDYVEPINIWTIIALPPGSKKTAAINAIMQAIREWETQLKKELRPKLAENATRRKVLLKQIDVLENSAGAEKDDAKREAALEQISRLREKLPAEEIEPQLWSGDTTAEAAQGSLVDQGERMALIADEGGLFEVICGLYTAGRANIDVFLQAHAGAPVRVNRQKRSCDLERPALTFGLAVQPDVISDLAKGDKQRLRGRGALARFLYCLPESNIGKRNVRQQQPVPVAVKTAYANVLHELLEGWQCAPDAKPSVLEVSNGARDLWYDFAEEVEKGKAGKATWVRYRTGRQNCQARYFELLVSVIWPSTRKAIR